MNSVRGAAMHDTSVNNAKNTVIVFMNEVDTLLQLILATSSRRLEFAQSWEQAQYI